MATVVTDSLPQFSKMVENKSVALIANNPRVRDIHPEADIVVRFNSDPMPADIWCTGFSGTIPQALHDACRLIVGSIPNCSVSYKEDQIDFRNNYRQSMPLISKPVEPVPYDLWRQLFDQVNGRPLSGLIMIHLLRGTRMQSCTLYGFDFHIQPENRAIRRRGKIGCVHDALASIWYVRSLLKSDPRFKAGTGTRLLWPMFLWKFHIMHDILIDCTTFVVRMPRRAARLILRILRHRCNLNE